MNALAITGYKPHELGIFSDKHPGIAVIKFALKKRLISFIEEGVTWFITSGQPGVELWASEVVIELREDFPDIQLAILTPFLEQETRWPEHAQIHYQEILAQADFVDSITKRPYENPSQLRLKNEFIIQKTDGLLVIYDDETEGTPSFYLKPAKVRETNDGYPIYFLNRYDLEAAEEEIRNALPESWD
ncbi:DUF1273 domain-containing protein [Pullulanibacillus sp. KACC 23026]|uniref:DUF1273 domain-containing protein n=1 Tax=Pullulanibacillus sp. KACC 23026 TaxID=3028315 RepID=UPI0023AEA369|nr:DUF1273 domain-containing protein [Pullulanibacillus sp. KACC 23026]WEG10783.1 DUF1273 domain-containing protein [Pullulanibacillus sp. KACC 23026]